MKNSFHFLYIGGSIFAAVIAAIGMSAQIPALYGYLPGAIGAICAGVAAVRFFRYREDLAGFVATVCGFVYYQAYQANPVTLPDFIAYIAPIPAQDQVVGIFFANLTTAMLLIGCRAVAIFGRYVPSRYLPRPEAVTRRRSDFAMLMGFWVIFFLVALPNALFGKVIIGPIETVIYQRAAWGDNSLSGYDVFGGAVGGSFANVTLWATSLFLVWLYLLGSRYRILMWVLAPLVLIWTAAVTLQGSRTYLVTIALALVVYLLGAPKFGGRVFFHLVWAAPLLFVLIQISTIFRSGGLVSFNFADFTEQALQIRGNEGASAEMDGIEYFRTEMFNRGVEPNLLLGAVRGIVERPIEGALMVVPRSVFPWKPDDESALEYNLFYQNVRLGVPSEVAFLGASPGLIGRELIRYGFLGPLTMLFWMGAALALADRLFAMDPASDFHRICAALLVAFFIAQSRDFVPVWFIPFLPAAVVFAWIALRSRPGPAAKAAVRTGAAALARRPGAPLRG